MNFTSGEQKALLGVAILAVVLAGIVYFANPSAEPSNQIPEQSQSKNNDPTAGWYTFQYDQLGFAFKYPEALVKEDEDFDLSSGGGGFRLRRPGDDTFPSISIDIVPYGAPDDSLTGYLLEFSKNLYNLAITDGSCSTRVIGEYQRLAYPALYGEVCKVVKTGSNAILYGVGTVSSNDGGGPIFVPYLVILFPEKAAYISGLIDEQELESPVWREVNDLRIETSAELGYVEWVERYASSFGQLEWELARSELSAPSENITKGLEFLRDVVSTVKFY